ncbi:hypothetical protein N0V90_009453 [Kalmusia sp. IMI 367209]|nr:hypothetical protein N0V90_009453 [Kalmusia sp. IMI 367209]
MAMNGVNGHVNQADTEYSIPRETDKIFKNGLLSNPLIAPSLPNEIDECAQPVEFVGTDLPSIPVNWRFAESIAALKGLEASMINVLLKRKYGLDPQKAIINTDHAQLFIMSVLLWTIDPKGKAVNFASMYTPEGKAEFDKSFKDCDLFERGPNPYKNSATNIYRCKDGRYFHIHGSMNPAPTQDSLGLPHSMNVASVEDSWKPYEEKVAQIESEEMQKLASDVHKQAGTICWTIDEYKNSEHGKANAHVGLYEVHLVKNEKQPRCWWPEIPETSASRPLAGLKVVDLTRVIAAPAVTRGLAEMGASVMRVTASHITDMSVLHCDLSWGKWTSHLDFREETDREKLRALVREADVVVQGYRPGVLDKYGFSPDGLLELTKDRERGLIVVRENCYGWYGPWSYRSGWQQISDANCGVSMEFGRAMGNDEPVTPVFPNSDFCTGTAGVIAVLNAILQRSAEGGSYKVDIALNYYSQWLVNSVGMYPSSVWQDVWTRNGKQVFRHYHNMPYTLGRFIAMLKQNSGGIIFNQEFFETRHSGAIGKDIVTPKPVVQFPEGKVQLRYNVVIRNFSKRSKPKNHYSLVTMNIPTAPTIETSRLRLIRITDTALSSDHLKWFHENWSDPIATSWSLHGKCNTLEESQIWFTEHLAKYDTITYIIFVKDGIDGAGAEYPGELVGNVGLRTQATGPDLPPFPPPTSTPDSDSSSKLLNLRSLGYSYLPKAWGKGYATEAAKAVLDAYRDGIATEKEKGDEIFYVEALCSPGNPASEKVLAKLGFRHIGYNEPPEKAFLAGAWRVGYNVSGLYV